MTENEFDNAGDTSAAAGTGVDAPDFGTLAWLRRASGDVRLPPWRLTPERLGAYAAGVRALVRGGRAVAAEDPGAMLDPDRQPLLRPWEWGDVPPAPGDGDPARALAAEVDARPALAAALRPHVEPAAFAAAQLKLTVCVRALVLLAGDGAGHVDPAQLRAWVEAQRPRPGAEADFAASVVTAVEGQAAVAAAFAG